MKGSVSVTLRNHSDFAGVNWPVGMHEPRKMIECWYPSITALPPLCNDCQVVGVDDRPMSIGHVSRQTSLQSDQGGSSRR